VGQYAFWDGDAGSYAGSSNDQLTGNSTFGGDHINRSFHLTGTTCFSDSYCDPSGSNQASSQLKDGQTSCDGVNPARIATDTVGEIVKKVLPMIFRLIFS
jgi:hypothetical protein